MGFRFSRRVSILPGLKLNLSGGGISLSAGVRSAHINLGPRGLYGSAGNPGTGLSYRQRLDSSSRSYDRPSVERRLSTSVGGLAAAPADQVIAELIPFDSISFAFGQFDIHFQ